MIDPGGMVSLAILAAAVAVASVLLGMVAALATAAREVALRARLRRIDARAARALDVRAAENAEITAIIAQRKKET